MGHVQVSRLIPASASDVCRHISNLENLADWLRPELDAQWPNHRIPQIKEGEMVSLYLARFNVAMRVAARVVRVAPGEGYTYQQAVGLFRYFQHTQTITAHDEKTSLLTDIVDFRMPFGLVGALLDDLLIKRDIERILMARLTRIEKRFERPAGELSEALVRP